MIPDELKHTKVVTTEPIDKTTDKITTESYYEELAHKMEEMQKYKLTSNKEILGDLVNCASLITKGSKSVVITIDGIDGKPTKLTWRWVTLKQSFNRK